MSLRLLGRRGQGRGAGAGGEREGSWPAAGADAFCTSGLDGDWAPAFGPLPARADVTGIIGFARLH